MGPIGIGYAPEGDEFFFYDGDECVLRIPRGFLLRTLIDYSAEYGDEFNIVTDRDGEECELVFLSPPTRDCIFGEDDL